MEHFIIKYMCKNVKRNIVCVVYECMNVVYKQENISRCVHRIEHNVDKHTSMRMRVVRVSLLSMRLCSCSAHFKIVWPGSQATMQ